MNTVTALLIVNWVMFAVNAVVFARLKAMVEKATESQRMLDEVLFDIRRQRRAREDG